MMKNIFDTQNINIEDLNNLCENTISHYLGMKFTEITPDYLKMELKVSEKTVQPLRIMHGGTSFVLAENIGSVAANLVLDREKYVALGLSLNGNHMKPVKEGETVFAYAYGLHIGRSTQVWEIQIRNEQDKMVFIGRLTMAVKPKNYA